MSKKKNPEFEFIINGEKNTNEINKVTLDKYDQSIDFIFSIIFFENFYGEVSSISMFIKDDSSKNIFNTSEFISKFKDPKESIWNRNILEEFLQNLSNTIINPEKSILIKNNKSIKFEEKEKTLIEYLLFIFTPINCYKSNLIEDINEKFEIKFNGNVRNHRYQAYQSELSLVCNLSNFLPIAEMFLIYQDLLNEDNFELYLKVVKNMLEGGKENMKSAKECKFFKILCLFIEKYPKELFSIKILNAFLDIGKTIFKNNFESLCENYFKYILLNEKILSKYNENIQIKFWDNIQLFCESDKSQIENFINMNRICLNIQKCVVKNI